MVESARLSGLQAAKDREIAELRAQIDDLKTDIAQKTAALGAAQAEAEQLKSRLDGAEKALAESQAALKAEVERYREQVGGALRIPGASGGKGLSLVRCSFPKN